MLIFRKGVEGKIARAIIKKKIQLVSMFILGAVAGSVWFYNVQEIKVLFAEKDKAEIIFENYFALKAEAEEIKEIKEVKAVSLVDELTDYIFLKESTRGLKNYSKCEAVGKYNRYGFGIPGNGTYLCFEKDMDTVAVKGWIAQKEAAGWSREKMLSVYSGGDYTK